MPNAERLALRGLSYLILAGALALGAYTWGFRESPQCWAVAAILLAGLTAGARPAA